MPDFNDLEAAIRRGDLNAIRSLVAEGVDIHSCDEHGYDALIHAAYTLGTLDDEHLIELLRQVIELGAPLTGVTTYGESAVGVLSHYGRFAAVKFLLEAGADPAEVQFSPLLKAAACGTVDDVADAIRAGANLEDRDAWNKTAFLIAVQSGDIAKADLLRRSGADIHARGRRGRPSTFFAVENRGVEMLSWLVERGIDIAMKDDSGATLLNEAVTKNNLACVEYLIGAGIDINEPTHVRTALWHARSKRSPCACWKPALIRTK